MDATEPTHIEYARVRATLDHPIPAVWRVVSAFGGVERWIVGVESCALEGSGLGAVRTLGLAGRSVRERLDGLDEAQHTIAYSILPPHTMPAENVRSAITLTELTPGKTEMLWRSEAARFDSDPAALRTLIEAFYSASIEGLRRLLA